MSAQRTRSWTGTRHRVKKSELNRWRQESGRKTKKTPENKVKVVSDSLSHFLFPSSNVDSILRRILLSLSNPFVYLLLFPLSLLTIFVSSSWNRSIFFNYIALICPPAEVILCFLSSFYIIHIHLFILWSHFLFNPKDHQIFSFLGYLTG